jgi:hypothetical protein
MKLTFILYIPVLDREIAHQVSVYFLPLHKNEYFKDLQLSATILISQGKIGRTANTYSSFSTQDLLRKKLMTNCFTIELRRERRAASTEL